jgi:hypothetical protein
MKKARVNVLLEGGTFITHIRRHSESGIVLLVATDFVNSVVIMFDLETGKQLRSNDLQLSEKEEAIVMAEIKKALAKPAVVKAEEVDK